MTAVSDQILDPKVLVAAKQMKLYTEARDDLIGFTKITMPDVTSEELGASRYKDALHHRAIAHALHEVEKGVIDRLIIEMPPRAGKSELVSRRFVPWFVGRDPYREVIFATYGGDFAADFGRKCREIMQSEEYGQVFPGVKLRFDSKAADRLATTEGGLMIFAGAGGALTGRGADLLVIDDPFKNREEADSETIRDSRWNWFTSAAYTRLLPGGRIVIVVTRWHEDDIVGRILDPEYVDPEEAATWKILKLPAIAGEDDPLKRKPGEALWPERYPIEVLERTRRTIGLRDWESLYQQNPSPQDGSYFKKEWLMEYTRSELPNNLRIYAASDHAVTKRQDRDASVMPVVGVDEDDIIWFLDDCWWGREETDTLVEAMITMMLEHRPIFWWAEDEHIKKSIGPFLRRRQKEERAFTPVVGMTSSKDLQQRARSFQGLCAHGQVRFPRWAPWWTRAKAELLAFPSGKNDDFVSAASLIGRGLDSITRARKPKPKRNDEPAVGTLAWVKFAHNKEQREKRLARASGMF